jgi:hypothetical protein
MACHPTQRHPCQLLLQELLEARACPMPRPVLQVLLLLVLACPMLHPVLVLAC